MLKTHMKTGLILTFRRGLIPSFLSLFSRFGQESWNSSGRLPLVYSGVGNIPDRKVNIRHIGVFLIFLTLLSVTPGL